MRPVIAFTTLAIMSAASWAQSGVTPVFKRTAGSWQISITLEKAEGTGIPAGTKEIMQDMLDKQSEKPLCLTPAAAAKEDFVGNMVNSAKNRNCKNVSEKLGDGSVNIVAQCADENGVTFTMSLEGEYSPISTTMMIKSENAPTPKGLVTMHMRTSSKWVGECAPGQQEIY